MFLPCFIVLIVHVRGAQRARLHFWQPQTLNVYNSYLSAASGILSWVTCLLLPLIYCLLHLRIGCPLPPTTYQPATSALLEWAWVGLEALNGMWSWSWPGNELEDKQLPSTCVPSVPFLQLCLLLRMSFISSSFSPSKTQLKFHFF